VFDTKSIAEEHPKQQPNHREASMKVGGSQSFHSKTVTIYIQLKRFFSKRCLFDTNYDVSKLMKQQHLGGLGFCN